MKRNYNEDYYPPAPFLQVRFGVADSGLYTDALLGMVDTGADATIVPLEYLDQIEASVEGFSNIRSHWGESTQVNLYAVDVIIEGRTLPGILVVGDEIGQEVVIGRNVLNCVRLLLDGLKRQSQIVGY